MIKKNLLWNWLSSNIHRRLLCIAKWKAETTIPFGLKLQLGALLTGGIAGTGGSLLGNL